MQVRYPSTREDSYSSEPVAITTVRYSSNNVLRECYFPPTRTTFRGATSFVMFRVLRRRLEITLKCISFRIYIVHVASAAIIRRWLKVGFHYPSSRAEFTGRVGRVHGRPVSTTRVHGPSWRVSKMHPSSRAVNSARELGPWTRVVETDLKTNVPVGRMNESMIRTNRWSSEWSNE